MATESKTITMPVTGMSCAACQVHVEKALRETPGVSDAQVNLMNHRARITFDPLIAQPDGSVCAVDGLFVLNQNPPAAGVHESSEHAHGS